MNNIGQNEQAISRREQADHCLGVDRGAEAKWVQAHLPGIRVLVRRHCQPNETSLDDVVEEIRVRLLAHLRNAANDTDAALPVFMQALVSTVVNQKKISHLKITKAGVDHTINKHACRNSGENTIKRDAGLRLVKTLLDEQVSVREHKILVRHYVHGQSQDGICTQLGIDASLLRLALHAARSRLDRLAESNRTP